MLCNIVIVGRTRMRSTLLAMLTIRFLCMDVVVFLYSINYFRKNGRKEKVHGLRLLYTFRDVLHPSKVNCLLYTVETLTSI